jgi:outer membrane protein assembly factor BamB
MKAFCLLLLLAAPAAAQEWTQFRGPNGTGISKSKGAPTQWTDKDYRWRVTIPGDSDGQPVIWGDKIFLLSAVDQGRERVMMCLNKEDGKELWSKKYPMATYKKGMSRTWSSSTPVVDKDRVVVPIVEPQQFLVKAWDHNGKELWSVNLGTFESQHGYGASPIFFENNVIVTNDQDAESFIVALDAKTGKVAWKSPRRPGPQGTAYCTPYVLLHEGAAPELLLTSKSHGISCLDARTGAAKWEAVVFDKRAVASAVVCGNLVIGTCGQGGGKADYVSAVKLGGKGDVTSSNVAWRIDKVAPYVPTPLVVGDRVFLMDDNGVAGWVEGATGKILWSERVEGTYYASPVMIGGKIYCTSEQGQVSVLEAGDAFKLVAKSPLGEGSRTTPCIDGDRIYFKTYTHLVCVGK